MNLDKRSTIIHSAMKLFVEHGFHGTSIAMIANVAYISNGTIYCYFKNKKDLIINIYAYIDNIVCCNLTNVKIKFKSVKDRFCYFEYFLFNFFIKHELYFKYVEIFCNSPYMHDYLGNSSIINYNNIINKYYDIFEDGVFQQAIKELPTPVLFALALGPLMCAVNDHIRGYIALDDTLIGQIIEACWNGIMRS